VSTTPTAPRGPRPAPAPVVRTGGRLRRLGALIGAAVRSAHTARVPF